MKSNEEILNENGLIDIPFDENVTIYYPTLLQAMQEAREDALREFVKDFPRRRGRRM